MNTARQYARARLVISSPPLFGANHRKGNASREPLRRSAKDARRPSRKGCAPGKKRSGAVTIAAEYGRCRLSSTERLAFDALFVADRHAALSLIARAQRALGCPTAAGDG